MKETTKPAVTKAPRLKDQEYAIVSTRIPKPQAEWLETEAAAGFRGRADQIAFLIDRAYGAWLESAG